jgi:hypothetical protein
MIWTFLIVLAAFIFISFLWDLNKDNDDLQGGNLKEKFNVIVYMLNDAAFDGFGKVTFLHKRSFNLYQDGTNQIITFAYSTGHLTISWRYKYFQKEMVHERQFNNVRNLSSFQQQRIAEAMIVEMAAKINQHQQNILRDAL